jgi:hypothetical protein
VLTEGATVAAAVDGFVAAGTESTGRAALPQAIIKADPARMIGPSPIRRRQAKLNFFNNIPPIRRFLNG